MNSSMGGRLYYFLKDVGNYFRELRLRTLETFLPGNYYVQQNADFNTRLNYFPEFPQEARFHDRHEKYRATRDANRVVQARLLLRLAEKCPEGEYAEVGTFRGNFARIMYRHKKFGSQLYCFDTFEGFASKDVEKENSLKTLKTQVGDFTATSLNQVYQTIGASAGAGDLVFRVGYFPDTFNGLEELKWRFVHLDVDLYEPSMNVLKTFWPRLVAGGVFLIHDYNGHYRGVSKAADEFFGQLGIPIVPLCDKVGSAVVIKA